MKPLSILAASALIAVLLAAPAMAASTTVTVTTDAATYTGTEAVHVSGTVSPAPASGQAVSFTVTNPSGQSYPLPNTASVDSTTGAFTTAFNTGGPYYTSGGTYTLTADFQGTLGSTTFTYTTTTSTSTGITQQQYNDIIGNITALSKQVSALQTTVNGLSSSSQVAALSTAVAGLPSSSQVAALSTAVAGLQGSLTTLSGTVGTINSNVGSIQSQLTTLTPSLQNAGATQTYVLVVAVLAAITLVLELAILVRKLS